MEKPKYVYITYIKTTPEILQAALTSNPNSSANTGSIPASNPI